MQIFENIFGNWKNFGKSSVKYLMKQFPEMFNPQSDYYDEQLSSLKQIAREAIVYPAFIETEDSYIIRFYPTSSSCPTGLIGNIPYVTRTKKEYKPFNIMSLYELSLS